MPKTEQRASDQDAAVEKAFVKGKLPEVDRRQAEKGEDVEVTAPKADSAAIAHFAHQVAADLRSIARSVGGVHAPDPLSQRQLGEIMAFIERLIGQVVAVDHEAVARGEKPVIGNQQEPTG
jgi:hypothetical protein